MNGYKRVENLIEADPDVQKMTGLEVLVYSPILKKKSSSMKTSNIPPPGLKKGKLFTNSG